MLTDREIKIVAADLREEVAKRKYVAYILAPDFAREQRAAELLIEVMEVVLHRRGLYIAPESYLKDIIRKEALSPEKPNRPLPLRGHTTSGEIKTDERSLR